MTTFELNQKYYFHDSLLDGVSIDTESSTVVLLIDFCYWAQPGYSDDAPETGMIRLTFSGVDVFPEIKGELGSYSILKTTCQGNLWVISALDDDTDTYYEVKIGAQSVLFEKMD